MPLPEKASALWSGGNSPQPRGSLLSLQTEGLRAYGGMGLSMGRGGRTSRDGTKLAAGPVREGTKGGEGEGWRSFGEASVIKQRERK